MSMIKWTPFIDPLLGDELENWPKMATSFTPAIDVYQDKNYVMVESPLAGIDPDKVDISIENDVLEIKGQTEKKTEVEDKNYYRKEVRAGSFYRAVQLPTRVVGDKAEAVYENGVLTVKIPKAPEAKPRSIKIKAKTAKSKK